MRWLSMSKKLGRAYVVFGSVFYKTALSSCPCRALRRLVTIGDFVPSPCLQLEERRLAAEDCFDKGLTAVESSGQMLQQLREAASPSVIHSSDRRHVAVMHRAHKLISDGSVSAFQLWEVLVMRSV